MTNLYQDLQALGLSANQAQVYLILVRGGQSKAGAIIKKTGLHRNLVYTALEELLEKRLISKGSLKGIAAYKMLSPARILVEPQEKARLAQKVVAEISLRSH